MKIITENYTLKDLQKRGDFRLKCNEILNVGDYVTIEEKVWTVKNAFQGKKEYIIFHKKGSEEYIRVSRSDYELERNIEEKQRLFRLKLHKCRTENPGLYERYWIAKEYEKQMKEKRMKEKAFALGRSAISGKSIMLFPLMMAMAMASNPFEHKSKH
ncbi:MAG: hypothetical protein NTU73_09960 [Ignavibacteriae bacterium]|nr:hypothetical protein [Ignavibacteriota bacterium]